MLKEQTRTAILELQKRYPSKRSALIPALHLAQAERGYLSQEVQKEMAELFEIEPNEVHAVVTFYDMFFDHPVGKHVIRVCQNLSCMLRGADEMMEKFCHKLKVEPHGTSADQEFTVVPAECLAACDRAPMLLVDDQVIGPISEEEIESILEEAKKRPGYASPVQMMEGPHA